MNHKKYVELFKKNVKFMLNRDEKFIIKKDRNFVHDMIENNNIVRKYKKKNLNYFFNFTKFSNLNVIEFVFQSFK